MINIKDNGLFKKCLVLVMAIALIATTVLTQFVSAEETGKWKEVAPMNVARCEFSSEVVNGKIYIFGGYPSITSVEEYDPVKNTWVQKASMKNKRLQLQTQVVNGKIYAIGGGNATVEEYDPATNTWVEKAPMKVVRSYHQTEVINGKIYAIGGGSATVEEYDPATNTWVEKASMKVPRTGLQTEVINGKIYAIGGGSATVEEYDPATNTWVEKAPTKAVRSYFASEVINGKIYAMGGYNATVEEYDPATNTWIEKAPMKTSRTYFATEVINGKIYAIGSGNSTEEYNPATNTWEEKASMKTARSYFETEVINGKIYAIGGWSPNLSSVEVYDTGFPTSPTLTVTPSADKVKVDKEFTTTIGIHNVKNIFAEDIKITYDKERFEYLGATPKTGIKICKEDTTAATSGTIRFIVASLGKGNEATGDKDLFDLKFRAKKAGQGKVDIIKGRIADNATLEIDVADANCGEAIITVEASVDVNRNGEITLLDLGIDAGYYNMKATDTDSTKHDADVVANGMIDDDDLTAITGDMLLNKNYTPNNA